MRNVILSTLALAIFLVGSIYLYDRIEDTSKNLSRDIDVIEHSIKEDHWDESKTLYDEFKEEWAHTSVLWMTFINHEEIDHIEESIKELDVYFYVRDQASVLENLSKLNYYLEHITLKEKASFYNIL